MPIRKRKRKLGNKESNIMKVYDIPISVISPSEENPQEMDEETFDEVVESIREKGFDEPCHVMPAEESGKYIMISGHHRMKAAIVVGMENIPCVIKEGYSDLDRKTELVKRNILHGSLNVSKFTKLYNDLSNKGGVDAENLKKMMGFTSKQAFDKVYKQVSDSLPKKHRAKLEEAKETIKSVDDLSSVLNRIFTEEGSELDNGFLVFSFGGKKHHYFKIGKKAEIGLKKLEKYMENNGLVSEELFDVIIDDIVSLVKRAKKGK
jgi:ParB/RepB/Spo0J family partition protein